MIFTFNCDPKFFSNDDLYKLATTIDFSELNSAPVFNQVTSQGAFTIEVPDSEVRIMQVCINEDIVGRGIDDQDTINNTGKMLYWLYDEILYQKSNR